MSNEEQKYGLEGIEQSQGYSPMPLADSPPPQEELASDAEKEIFIATRDDPAPIVERAFFDETTGEKRPETEVVSAEDAARNLANTRLAEKHALEDQQKRDLQDALDQLQPVAVDEQVTGRAEAQPDYTPQPDPESVQATDPNIDPEIAAALRNPKIRGLLEATSQQVEQTKAQFQQATAELATQAQGVLTALFPELSNLSGPQLQGALQYMQQSQPERFQQFQQLAGRAQQLVGVYRQQQAQAAQQQQELAAAEFKKFATWHDAQTLVNETPESMKQIQSTLLADARAAGISETDIVRAWNSTPALRHSFVQNLMGDGVKWRIAQRNIGRAISRPVANVQRPGSSAGAPTRLESALAEARSKLKPEMSAKEAAAYVIARRAAR